MVARSISELEAEWLKLEKSKKFSDGLISFGPFGIGFNGFIALFSSFATAIGGPLGAITADGLFEIYTVIVGLYLLGIAMSTRASAGTVMKILIYMTLDGFTDVLPVLGGILDATFRFPRMAARAIQKDIENTHWVETSWREAKASGDYERHWAEARAQGKHRVVFLQD
jgi:hypothetical protein